jgi:hypothetical protein
MLENFDEIDILPLYLLLLRRGEIENDKRKKHNNEK